MLSIYLNFFFVFKNWNFFDSIIGKKGGNENNSFILSDPIEGTLVINKPLDYDNGIREFKIQIQASVCICISIMEIISLFSDLPKYIKFHESMNKSWEFNSIQLWNMNFIDDSLLLLFLSMFFSSDLNPPDYIIQLRIKKTTKICFDSIIEYQIQILFVWLLAIYISCFFFFLPIHFVR